LLVEPPDAIRTARGLGFPRERSQSVA